MKNKILIAICLIVISISFFSTLSIPVRAKTNVNSINIDVYWDGKCTKPMKNIDWGILEPGSSTVKVIYIKNKSKIPLVLHLYCSDVNPFEAEKYIILDWDKEGYTIDARSVIKATLTLSIPHSRYDITDFHFNIIIEGTG